MFCSEPQKFPPSFSQMVDFNHKITSQYLKLDDLKHMISNES